MNAPTPIERLAMARQKASAEAVCIPVVVDDAIPVVEQKEAVRDTARFRLPTLAEAVDIIGMQLSLAEQKRQARYMADTQDEKFARQAWAKAEQAGKIKKK